MTAARSPLRRVWEESPERVAWAILFLSFFTCIALAVGTPLSVHAFVRYARVGIPVQAQTLQGTPLLLFPGERELAALTGNRVLMEGTRLRTDQSATALLLVTRPEPTGKQKEVASVLVYTNTEVRLQSATTPRFPQWSDQPARGRLSLDQGRIRVAVGPFNHRPLVLTVETPHGTVTAQDASFSVFATNQGTEVTVREGQALVRARDRAVVVSEGQRVQVPLGRPPLSPVAAERNLVRNGTFSRPLETTWSVGFLQPEGVTAGTVSVVEVGGRKAVRFSRMAEGGVHTEVWIEQVLNADVQDVDSLILRMEVRLLYQSLPGGGMLGSEYPLMVRIDFTDIYGKDQFWVHGFYFRDPQFGWPTYNGEKITPFVWWPYESPNLITLWREMGAPPAVLRKIRLYASGHNYQSMVTDVELIAR